MIVLCFMQRSELNNVQYEEASLSKDRRLKLSRLKNEGSRQLAVCAELALIKALKEYGACPKLPLQIEERGRGKLFFYAPESFAGHIFFSLSHAGDMAVAAVSDHDLGVDIEEVSRKMPSSVGKILHPENYSYYESLTGETEKREYFFDTWTRMESYMKLIGEGLYMKTVKIEVLPSGTVFSEEADIKGYIHPASELIPYERDRYRCNICTARPEEEISVVCVVCQRQ